VTEAPYRIDRLITQLRLSGALDGVVGIALGDFETCDPPANADYTLGDVLRAVLEPLGVPVWKGLQTGHGEANLPWFVGASGTLGQAGLVQEKR
jgi:muramoyltetrapeptide carboxypeptidase